MTPFRFQFPRIPRIWRESIIMKTAFAFGLVVFIMLATATIHQMQQASALTQKQLVFRQAIALLQGILSQGMADNAANLGAPPLTQQTFYDYFLPGLCYTKLCEPNTFPTGAGAKGDGCIVGQPTGGGFPPADSYNGNTGEGAVWLPNGASIAGLHNAAVLYYDGIPERKLETVWIDWDGLAGSNTIGDDVLDVTLCIGTQCRDGILPGAIGPTQTVTIMMPVENLALWNAIWAP